MRTTSLRREASCILAGFFSCLISSQIATAGVVTECNESALRLAIAGGGLVTLECDGIITLTEALTISADTILDTGSRSITISGGGNSRIFLVESNRHLTLLNLTLAEGRASYGGAIRSEGGNLTASNCVFRANLATATNEVMGGAIYQSGGSLELFRCVFEGNRALVAGAGSTGTNAVAAMGGNGGTGWPARGGAVWNSGSALIKECYFFGNSSTGGAGGTGGSGGRENINCGPCRGFPGGTGGMGGIAAGGGVFHLGDELRVVACTFASNSVAGGSGGLGGLAGIGSPYYDGPGGIGGTGGTGTGAGIHAESGTVMAINNTWFGNRATGGNGGSGSTTANWCAPGGVGGYGGNSQGGALFIGGAEAVLSNNTLAHNAADAGTGGGGGLGGFCQPAGARSVAPSGSSGTGRGGGLASTTNSTMVASTLFAFNFGGNGFGPFMDGGFNISSDASLLFTNQGGWINLDPKLSVLSDNGGPTPTMALHPESPAIDHSVNGAGPPTDQRGVARTSGSRPDAGAYEFEQPQGPAACDADTLLVGVAAGGVFRPTCQGVYRLTKPLLITSDTTIDGSGLNVVLSGGRGTRVVHVNPGVSLTLIHVTVQDGLSTNGAGIFNDGGVVTLVDCVVATNRATGLPAMNGTDAPQNGSSAQGGNGIAGTDAKGGGVYNSGVLRISNSAFLGNNARAGDGGSGGAGGNSAPFVDGAGRCRSAVGGSGGSGGKGGSGLGGAIYNLGSVTMADASVAGSQTMGGNGGSGGAVGGASCLIFAPGGRGGDAGAAGPGRGGAIHNEGRLELSACALYGNSAEGGNGGVGGAGMGGYAATGTDGTNAPASGGAIYNLGTNTLVNVTMANNSSKGAGCGSAQGGAIQNGGRLEAWNCTIWLNGTRGNSPESDCSVTGDSLGASIHTEFNRWTRLVNCIVGNPAFTNNCTGRIMDGGHNLYSDSSVGFIASGSVKNIDPRLGPIANNGGLTWTMALQPSSPALDSADAIGCPQFDQRGIPRPIGGRCDIGAFEGVGGIIYPAVIQSFLPDEVSYPDKTLLRFWISNSCPVELSNLALSGQLPPAQFLSNTTNTFVDCPVEYGCVVSNSAFTVSGIDLLPGESCILSLSIAPPGRCGMLTGSLAMVSSPAFYPPMLSPPGKLLVRRPETSAHAIRLDGVRDMIQADIQDNLARIYRFTISLWVRTTTKSGGGLIGRYSTSSGLADQHIYMANSGQIVAGIAPNPPFPLRVVASPRAYNDGKWHWVVANFSQPGVKLYLDGDLVASDPILLVSQALTGAWTIGYLQLDQHANRPASNFFSGEVDDIQVWNRDRSIDELILDFERTICGNEQGLFLCWRADEGQGVRLFDSGLSQIHATFFGSPSWTTTGAPVVDFKPISRVSDMELPLRMQAFVNPAGKGVLLSSTNLMDWQPFQTNVASADGLISFRETFMLAPFRYYRTVGQ